MAAAWVSTSRLRAARARARRSSAATRKVVAAAASSTVTVSASHWAVRSKLF